MYVKFNELNSFSFAPNLLVIAKSLRMSEYLAGVTILPLGNGLADLINGFEKYDGDTEMWSNEAMGKLPSEYATILFKVSLFFS